MKNLSYGVLRFGLMVGLLVTAACLKADGTKGKVEVVKIEAGHSHERGKMLIADVGKYHALLTAHLAKAGNELDIFFETQDEEDPQPVAIPLDSFTLEAETAEGGKHELVFKPAPADERPQGEKPGAASHFVAEAGWMKPSDTLSIAGKITLEGKNLSMRWKDFNPKKYAHHDEVTSDE